VVRNVLSEELRCHLAFERLRPIGEVCPVTKEYLLRTNMMKEALALTCTRWELSDKR